MREVIRCEFHVTNETFEIEPSRPLTNCVSLNLPSLQSKYSMHEADLLAPPKTKGSFGSWAHASASKSRRNLGSRIFHPSQKFGSAPLSNKICRISHNPFSDAECKGDRKRGLKLKIWDAIKKFCKRTDFLPFWCASAPAFKSIRTTAASALATAAWRAHSSLLRSINKMILLRGSIKRKMQMAKWFQRCSLVDWSNFSSCLYHKLQNAWYQIFQTPMIATHKLELTSTSWEAQLSAAAV